MVERLKKAEEARRYNEFLMERKEILRRFNALDDRDFQSNNNRSVSRMPLSTTFNNLLTSSNGELKSMILNAKLRYESDLKRIDTRFSIKKQQSMENQRLNYNHDFICDCCGNIYNQLYECKYTCNVCIDYELCSSCFNDAKTNKSHLLSHPMTTCKQPRRV